MTDDQMRREILSAGPDDGDWMDVVRRATRARHRSQIYAAVAVAALVVVGVASAYALGHPIIDFRTADNAPHKVIAEFDSLDIGAPEGMATGVLSDQARAIPGLYLNGEPYELGVAPTKEGGFCISQSGCIANGADRRTMDGRISISIKAPEGLSGPCRISGEFLKSEGERLEVAYADGTSEEVPFVWVTAPINAGFFVFDVPEERRVNSHRPVSVVLFDRAGKVLVRESIPDLEMAWLRSVNHSPPGYPHLSVPPEAIWEKRRQLFDLRADDGARIGLWVAPGRDGSTCVWTTQSYGCFDSSQVEKGVGLGIGNGGTHVTLGGDRVGEGIVKIEARFEDGDKVELTPKEGFLIWPIPSRHYPLGHRLEELVGYDASGQMIARQSVSTTESGLYP